MHNRPQVSTIAWISNGGRPREIAVALEGEARSFHDLGIVRKPLVPLRYLLSSIRTLAYLARRRPRAVVVQAPPVPLALIAWLYGRVSGAPLVVDSHPVAFAFDGSVFDRLMLPVLKWVMPRAAGCLVTTDELREQVEEWGGRGFVFHEAPPEWSGNGPQPDIEPDSVLFVNTFAPDEPLAEVLGAARRLPHVRFRITGDLRRLSPGVRRLAAGNVEWLGYLTGDSYPGALRQADVVLTLTDRKESVPRSAYEAVYAERPLVTTDWPHMAELFPYAVKVKNNANSIAEGLERALDSSGELHAATTAALELQTARWESQVEHLRSVIFHPKEGIRNE